MKKSLMLIIIIYAITSKVSAQCESMLNDATSYYQEGNYKGALYMYNMLKEANCMDVSAKINECNKLIQEDEDYKKCYSIRGCESYLKKHPKGRYVTKVQKKQSDLLAKEMVDEAEDNEAFARCVDELSCDEYLQNYPRGRHLEEVLAMKAQYQEEREALEAQRRLEWEMEASKTAFMDIQTIEFANLDSKKNVLNDYGSALYVSDMRYLTPKIVYAGIYDRPKIVTVYCKLFDPNGDLITDKGSPKGYTFEKTILVRPSEDNNDQLPGYGSSTPGILQSGDYEFELWYQDSLIYYTSVTISDNVDALTIGKWRKSLSDCFVQTTLTYKQGNAYKGQLSERQRSGLGIFMWPNDGSYYVGEWKTGKMDGTGISIKADGYQVNNCPGALYYVGKMSGNNKSGIGRCYDKFGNLIYEGTFANDTPTQTYHAENNSLKFECFEYSMGCYYVGETKDGQCHGKGMLIWRWSDEIWYGDFVDGERNGYGILLSNDGDVSTGYWIGDEKQ